MEAWIFALIGAAATLLLGGAAYGGYRAVLHIRSRRAVPAARAALQGASTEAVYARSVDRIDISDVRNTGLTTPIPRYKFDLELWWTDDAGVQRHHGPQEYTWPNDLSDVPLRIVKGWATDLITQAVRWRLGLEPVPGEP